MKPFKYLPGALRTLLLANAAIFIIAFLGRGLEVDLGAGYGSLTDYISYYGAFMPRVPLELWRYVTYMFIHFDFMHFFFNMLMLWMFGSEVAEWMGSRHFVAMYFFCGIFAALFSFFMCLLGLTNNPIIGASGALMGVFVAYYKFFPDRMILMFFVIPMRIKHAVLYHSPLSAIFRLFSSNPEKYSSGQSRSRSYQRDSVEEPEVLEGEVFYVDEQQRMDEILKKVERNGIQSLSEAEREFLLKAGDKLRRRRGGF